MKLKRSKAYKKQMAYLQLNFNFREPYQVLVDEELLLEAVSTKYDLVAGLERTLQGKVKPMITQCTIEHLYRAKTPEAKEAIKIAKTFDRRRCGHIQREEVKDEGGSVEASGEEKNKTVRKPTPLSAFECIKEVVGSKNRHRYCVATQKFKLRLQFREIPAIPLIYMNRSVMILEPMSKATEMTRKKIEENKLVSGLNEVKRQATEEAETTPSKKRKAKEPNPLSVKKKTKTEDNMNDGEKKRRRGKRGGTSHKDSIETADNSVLST